MASNIPPILPNAPTANILPSLAEYLLSLPDIAAYINNTANYYRRLDYSDRALPALNLYETSTTLEGGLGWLNGEATLEVVMPPQFKRENVVDNTKYISDLLFLYLNAADTIVAILPNNPGLTDLASSTLRWDYSASIAIGEGEKRDAYILTGTINYRVNLLEYYESIQTGDLYETATVTVTPCST